MKIYALCLMLLVIVVAFLNSGCAGSTAELAPRTPVEMPGEIIVEFTDSAPRTFVHDVPVTRLAPDTADRPLTLR